MNMKHINIIIIMKWHFFAAAWSITSLIGYIVVLAGFIASKPGYDIALAFLTIGMLTVRVEHFLNRRRRIASKNIEMILSCQAERSA